jgi:RNA polymerase sigma-70 factor (ECF subfamily)
MMKRTQKDCEANLDFNRLRRREKGEVDRWFDTYADPVYAFIFYRTGRDADLAGDVAQETFVTALETIERFDPRRGQMFPWLTHIARNCIKKARRRQGRDDTPPDFWETVDRRLLRAVTEPGSASLPEDLLAQQETAALVRMALTNLPFRYQLALRRRYFEDLSLHEMANLEGSSEGAIKVLLHRSRQAFRAAFESISASLLEDDHPGRAIP